MKVYGRSLSEEDRAYKEKWQSRLKSLDASISPSRTVPKIRELIWSYIDQLDRGHKLTKKQIEIVSTWEYKRDTIGEGWEKHHVE